MRLKHVWIVPLFLFGCDWYPGVQVRMPVNIHTFDDVCIQRALQDRYGANQVSSKQSIDKLGIAYTVVVGWPPEKGILNGDVFIHPVEASGNSRQLIIEHVRRGKSYSDEQISIILGKVKEVAKLISASCASSFASAPEPVCHYVNNAVSGGTCSLTP